MSHQSLDLISMGSLFALISTLVVQMVKPVYDKIPGITMKSNQTTHDNGLRLIQYAINFGLLYAASLTLPSAFAGLYWWDLVAISIGQGILSHFTYKTLSTGSSDLTDDITPGATSLNQGLLDRLTFNQPSDISPSSSRAGSGGGSGGDAPIPIVPR